MRILWFSGVQLPAVTGAEVYRASWQESLRQALEEFHPEVELGIASYGGIEYEPHHVGNACYFNIFRSQRIESRRVKRLIRNWRHFQYDPSEIQQYVGIVNRFKPDGIMYYGSENPFGLIYRYISVPSLLNIQGITSMIAAHTFDGILRRDFLAILLSRNLLNGTGTFHEWLSRKKYANVEREIYKNCQNFTGRTAWDRHFVEIMNPNAKYHNCDEILGKPYYEGKWHQDYSETQVIYSTSSNALFKGSLSLLYAIHELHKRGWKQVRLRIGGINPASEVGRLFIRRMKEFRLEDNIVLLGNLAPRNIIQEMMKASIYVMPSHVENSSNSLCEAMLMGMPCIASDAGGTTSILHDEENGLIYPHMNVVALADKIEILIKDLDKAGKLGYQARQSALQRHDPRKNARTMVDIFKKISII